MEGGNRNYNKLTPSDDLNNVGLHKLETKKQKRTEQKMCLNLVKYHQAYTFGF